VGGEIVNESDERIELAEYVSALRAELSKAQSQASADSLKLGVEGITLELNVAYTLTKTGEASAGVKAKFWVLELGEAGAKGSLSSSHTRTQRLLLTLKPRVEQEFVNREGQTITMTRGVDVTGGLEETEENPDITGSV